MALRQNNPFSNGYRYKNDEGLIYRDAIKYNPGRYDKTHLVKGGDRIDVLAGQYYGDSKYWWVIYDTNEGIENPFELEVGTLLIIPNLDIVRVKL